MATPKTPAAMAVKETTGHLDLTGAIELENVWLHQSITIPTLQINEKTLNAKKCQGFRFFWKPGYVIMESGTKKCIIPDTNVSVCVVK